jgi:hypothetical protein
MEKNWWCAPVIPAAKENVMWSRLAWAKSETPISKITRTKRARGVAQAAWV